MIQKSISVGAKAVGPAACTCFPEREKGEYVRFNFSNVIAIVTLFIALMLSGAPPMRGQTVDTINYKWAKSIGGTVADAKFHPITGNILAAVNTSVGEIWEIDPNTGETIRIMEQQDPYKTYPIMHLEVLLDGSKIIANNENMYDYQTGKFEKVLLSDVYLKYGFDIAGMFLDSKRLLLHIYPGDVSLIAIYDIALDTIIATYNPKNLITIGPNLQPFRMSLSPDGKYIAMVFKNQYDPYWYPILVSVDSMKAVKDGYFWMNDDESIKVEPTDIKWSKDSKYVGFRYGNGKLSIFDVSEWINSKWQSGKYVFEGSSFDFTQDSKNLIYTYLWENPKITDIKKSIIKAHFQAPAGYITTNNNQGFMGWGLKDGPNLQCTIKYYDYSSVEVKEPKGQATPIQTIQYQQGILTLTVNTQEPINKITITDIAGKTLYQSQQVASIDWIVQIPIKLVVGTYFITMQIGKSVFNEKLLVVGR